MDLAWLAAALAWSTMFTGIIEETGTVEEIRAEPERIRLVARAAVCGQGLTPGSSLAVNGCCLTVVKVARAPQRQARLHFDLLRETWDRTNLRFARRGSSVNLERPLRADGRLDGHFVTGHIDGTGEIARWEPEGGDHLLEIAASSAMLRYIVFKGSIAVDGISLTIAQARKKSFTVWIIPHTFQVTALRERKIGDLVNLEADILAKVREKFAKGARA